jgi:hypothetical protein
MNLANVLPVTVLQSGWYESLAVFVGFNTVLFAILCVLDLLPRRRR